MRLRYTGVTPTTFIEHGFEIEPGGEFDVDEESVPRFTVRHDIVVVPQRESENVSKRMLKSVSDTPQMVPEQAQPDADLTTGDQVPGTDAQAE